jgi:hypothetical protein
VYKNRTPDDIVSRLQNFKRQPPLHEEESVREQLTLLPPELHDHRAVLHKMPMQESTPNYNHLYDSLGSINTWRYCNDAFANGTFTPTSGGQISVPVILKNPPNWKQQMWPGGVNCYFYLRQFNCAPQSTPATPGAVEILFQEASGTAPLVDFVSSQGINISPDVLLLTPIADPGDTAVGNLLVSLNGGATAVIYNYAIGFGVVYLLPSSTPARVTGYTEEIPSYGHSTRQGHNEHEHRHEHSEHC